MQLFLFLFPVFVVGGKATALLLDPPPLLVLCVCMGVSFASMCVPLMLMYALAVTLIDLAALLAQYSFFPNLSLSWLLWLLISQLQKRRRQRDFSARRRLLLHSFLMFFLSLVCSLSSPCHLCFFLPLSPSFDRGACLVDGSLFNVYQGN